jgi:hypothetical protein
MLITGCSFHSFFCCCMFQIETLAEIAATYGFRIVLQSFYDVP